MEIAPRLDMVYQYIPHKADRYPKPLVLPGEGFSAGESGVTHGLSPRFYDLFKKHGGKFCLTAVIAELGVQSNTIAFNGCVMPPEKYVPWKLSKFTAERIRARRREQELRDTEYLRWQMGLPPLYPQFAPQHAPDDGKPLVAPLVSPAIE